MTASAKTLRAIERAAMAQFRRFLKRYGSVEAMQRSTGTGDKLIKACAAHAAALKRKRTGRR